MANIGLRSTIFSASRQFHLSDTYVPCFSEQTGLRNTLVLDILTCAAEDFYEDTNYSTISGIAAYRSALTLEQLADEDSRQREYAHVFEKDASFLATPVFSQELKNSVCMEYPRPAAGKVARLMLELLKNLEGDDGLIQGLGYTLVRTNLLLRTSQLEVEPDLSALVQTPQLMQGEPHVTLPRVLAVAWVLASDPQTTKENGWCPIEKLTEYLDSASPSEIAVRMRAVDPILARARFILEDFMQNMMPLHMGRQLQPVEPRSQFRKHENRHSNFINVTFFSDRRRTYERPTRGELVTTSASTPEMTPEPMQRVIELINGVGAVTYTYVCLVLCLFVI